MITRLLLLFAGMTFVVAADDVDVKYRARKFRSSREGRFKSYQPSKQTECKRFEAKPFQPESEKSASWGRSFQAKPYVAEHPKELPDLPVYTGKLQEDQDFEQKKDIRVRSIAPDPRQLQEKKPFVSGVKGREEKHFEAKERKASKNPLLKPRQGIREVAPDAE